MKETSRASKFSAKAAEGFNLWAMRTETALRSKKVFNVVSTVVIESNTDTINEAT